jgi:protocatechuate 3,4-dioxygenase beta subunit
MIYILFINLLISSFCFNVLAKSPEEVLYNYEEIPTEINYYPYSNFSFDDKDIKWNTSNNLRRKAGSSFFAIGEPLLVEGYILDTNGVPISGVEVRLIQTNASGVYTQMTLKTEALYDANFTGNGISITDNRGYYSFISIFPGYYNNRAPHLHIRINYQNLQLETEIFFAGHPRNKTDYKYNKLTIESTKNATADVFFIDAKNKNKGKVARFDLVLNVSQGNKVI